MNKARKQTKVITVLLVVGVILYVIFSVVWVLIEETGIIDFEDKQVYTLEVVEGLEKLSKQDKRLKEMEIELGDNEVAYLTNILIDNQDTEEISYLSIDAEDQDGNYISCAMVDPYDYYSVGSRSVIPAGVSRAVPVIVTLYKDSMEEIESINFYRWDSDGDEEKVCTISMDEVVNEDHKIRK